MLVDLEWAKWEVKEDTLIRECQEWDKMRSRWGDKGTEDQEYLWCKISTWKEGTLALVQVQATVRTIIWRWNKEAISLTTITKERKSDNLDYAV